MSKAREIADQNAITVDDYPASQTPAPNKIPVADGSGKLDGWVSADMEKSVYDTNGDGIVDNSDLIRGKIPNISVNTIPDLLAVDTAKFQSVNLLGYHTQGDRGGGVFYWDVNEDKANHNGGTIIDPNKTFPSDWTNQTQLDTWFNTTNTGNGCWKRVFDSEIYIKWFGVKGDGVTDDTKAIQKCYLVCSDITINLKDTHTIIISGEINVNSGTITIGSGTSKIKQTKNNTGIFLTTQTENVAFYNVYLEGVGATDTASTVNDDNAPILINARAFGIFFDRCNNVTVKNCSIKYFKNFGIRFAYSSNVNIEDNNIVGTYPDSDISDGDTSHQQFGIISYAASDAEFGYDMTDVINGVASRHGNNNIKIIGNTISYTAIAISIFPGFKNVSISNNTTLGSLSQHSIYIYPYENINIVNNILSAEQYVGIKISCNVQAELYIPKNILINSNIINNCTAPSISIEMFDKLTDGSYNINLASLYFDTITIIDNIISDGKDYAIVAATTKNLMIKNNTIYNMEGGNFRGAIQFRGSFGTISNNFISNINSVAIGGQLSIDSFGMHIKDNIFEDCNRVYNSYYIDIAPTVDAFLFSISRTINWYGKDAIIKNSSGDVYLVLNSGVADSEPTGTGDVTSGDVTFRYLNNISNITLTTVLDNNMFLVKKGTIASGSININDSVFDIYISNNYADENISSARINGKIYKNNGNNFRNAYKASNILSAYPVGIGSSVYFNTSAPTSGTYQVGDIVWNIKPTAGSNIGWVCVTAGSPGTWKTFGTIAS